MNMKLDEFTKAYLHAMLWVSTDDDTSLETNFSIEDIAPETLKQAIDDCQKFQTENAVYLDEKNCLKYGPDYGPIGHAGHDFWLTRHHHGCGFWDGDWEEKAGEKLTEASTQFRELYPYVHNGKIYCD